MEKRYVKIEGWYFPIDGVLFRLHPERETVLVYEIGGDNKHIWEIAPKRSTSLIAFLDTVSFDVDAAKDGE